MPYMTSAVTQADVALLAEGVDRNHGGVVALHSLKLSPSSRRAWIEISSVRSGTPESRVALLAEGVDRNSAKMPVPSST